MAITINILIPERSLAGNPVIAQLYAGSNASKRYRIYGGAAYVDLIYEGSIYSIADTYSTVDVSTFFADRAKIAGVDVYKIVLVDDTNTETDTTYFSIYGGAISKLIMRKIGINAIFTEKLKKSNDNFFLTTRTADRVICIPEDELLPLYFYRSGMKLNIKADGVTIWSGDYTIETVDSLDKLDIKQLRADLVTSSAKLVNVFDITTDTSYSCSIVITTAETRTDFFLKFRNSWGAEDMIGIRGDVDYAPAFAEAVKINQWDNAVNDFITNQERRKLINTLTAITEYKTDDERLLLLDMLLSSEVTLIVYDNEYAVNVTSDSTIFESSKPDPTNISLKIELKDIDGAFSPIVIKPAYKSVVTTTLAEISANNATIIV